MRNVSERIARTLRDFKFKVFFRPPPKLSSILHVPKDRPPLQDTKGVVYKIQCNDCDLCYVGQTGNALSSRVKQHQAACRLFQLEKSAVAAHSVEAGHRINWQDAEVLSRELGYRKRLFLEA